jgi:hypothetical protein
MAESVSVTIKGGLRFSSTFGENVATIGTL